MAMYKQAAATNQVKIGAGKLNGIFVSSTTGGTLAIYDSAASSDDDPVIVKVFTPTALSMNLVVTGGIWFSKGLYIVAANTIEFTVVFE